MAKRTYWSHLRQELVSACPMGRPINGFDVYDAPLPLTNRGERKRVHVIPLGGAISCGSDAVKSSRKALGRAVVGKRLVGEPIHLLNPEELSPHRNFK